jgi:type II secretory pathway pseudopilin PulG
MKKYMIREQKKANRGSVLIWALIAVLVLSIMLATGLAIVSASMNRATSDHSNQQAYYTAMSITKTYADWLRNTSETDQNMQAQREKFMESLETNKSFIYDFTAADLGTGMGDCRVEITYTDDDPKKIKIVSTATYQEQESTVTATLTGADGGADGKAFPVSEFTAAPYDLEAAALNNISVGDPINVFANKGSGSGVSFGLSDSASAKRDYNSENQAYVDSQITDTSSNREVTWFETSSTATINTFSGVRDMPYIGESLFESKNAPFAAARVVTPKNGRFAFNPINTATGEPTYSSSATAARNTKYAGFNIDDTAGRNILVRLANDAKLSQRTSNMPLNAIISIDFTDNQYSTVPDSNGNYNSLEGAKIAGSLRYWPVKWNMARIYTRNVVGEKIDANLLIGPYSRIHTGDVLDYRGWGHYRNKHKGGLNEYWEYCKKMLNNTHLTGSYYRDVQNNTGMPLVSVEWGDNMGIYILDDTDKYVRLTQGINLFDGIVYSMRDTQIGGGIVWKNTGDYFDNITNDKSGFLDYTDNFTLYAPFTCSQNQVIANTDIVLLSPTGKTRNSVIRHPDSWKNFEGRKLTIEGGNIYVGARQTLTIQSEVKDGLAVKGLVNAAGNAMVGSWASATARNYTENGNTMDIAPDQILVDEGGTLTIMANQNNRTNVNTDIYVKGTLNIEAGAKIKGNIYVYGGKGLVNVKGDFTLNRPDDSPDGAPSGIFIYGDDTEDKTGTLTGAGWISFTGDSMNIAGNGGNIHLLNSADKGTLNGNILCDDRDSATGMCRHFGRSTDWSVQYAGS